MIIASVVTIPDRIPLLLEALNSILVSTQRPDFLYVSVAKWYPRLEKSILTEELNILTDYLDSFEIPNKLVQYDEDIGPLMKFLTPLENHELTNQDHIISAYCLKNNIPLRLANIKEKIGDPPGSELYYTPKETHNGIMQSPEKDQNWIWLFEIFRENDIISDYF